MREGGHDRQQRGGGRRLHVAMLSLILAVAFAAPLRAASILSVRAAFGPGHDGDALDDVGPDRLQRTSTLSVSNDSASFLTRFAAALAADADAGGSNLNLGFNVDYLVTVAIGASVGESWELLVDHSRYGALMLVDDDSGRAAAAAQDVFVTVTGATLTSGALDLPAAGSLRGGAGGYLDIRQTLSGVLTGVGSQIVTLQFNFQLRAHTIAGGGAGDEAGVLMGLASALDSLSFSAGEYPGVSLRRMDSDGQFVSARLVTAEPGPFVAVSLGLLGLAVLGRDRQRTSLRGRFAHRRR